MAQVSSRVIFPSGGVVVIGGSTQRAAARFGRRIFLRLASQENSLAKWGGLDG